MYRFIGTYWHHWLLPTLSIICLFAVLFLLFPFDTGYSTIRDPLGLALWSTWWANSPDGQDYGYCLLVPILVIYLIIQKRSQIAKVPIHGNNAALILIVLGLVLFWIGSRAGKQFIGCIAIQILLGGIILWFYGRGMVRPLLFTWALLAFAWPWPFIDSAVAFPLRLIVSKLAFHTLNLIGISTFENGTALLSAANPSAGLQLGDLFQIDIANPCSGLHSLLPLLMFSAVFSYLFLQRTWHQWLVFLSAFPFAIIGNIARILLLVIACIHWGAAFALGTTETPSQYHEYCGFAVFVIVLGLECFLGFILIKLDRRYNPAQISNGPEFPQTVTGEVTNQGKIPFWRSGVVFGLAAVMAIAAWNNPPPFLSPEAGVVTSLPTQVKLPEPSASEFFGLDTPVSEAELTILPKDTEFARKNYSDLHGHEIFFSIVLSGLQQYTIHPPQVCLVAQGWNIVREEDVPIHLLSGREMAVRNLTIEREEVNARKDHRLVRAYYMYWYVADGISTPSRATRNWLSSWDRIFHNRDHRWAYVIAMSSIKESSGKDGENPVQTRQMLANFIREIVPSIQKSEMSGFSSN